jgi:hypothetical protein
MNQPIELARVISSVLSLIVIAVVARVLYDYCFKIIEEYSLKPDPWDKVFFFVFRNVAYASLVLAFFQAAALLWLFFNGVEVVW